MVTNASLSYIIIISIIIDHTVVSHYDVDLGRKAERSNDERQIKYVRKTAAYFVVCLHCGKVCNY